MPYYRASGEIPRKRHIRFHRPDGGLYAEELMGEEGFSSDSSLLYHVHPPTAIVKSEALPTWQPRPVWCPIIRCCPGITAPRTWPAAAIWYSARQTADGQRRRPHLLRHRRRRLRLYRNSTGDEAVYVHAGSAAVRVGLRRDRRRAPATTSSCRAAPSTAGCPAGDGAGPDADPSRRW